MPRLEVMMVSRLNVFQRLARQWDELHPYNAAQAMRIAGQPDLGRLQDTWQEALGALGLGRVRVAGSTFRYECLNGEAARYGVREVPAEVGFEEHVSRELNRRFDDPEEPPFRPFVIAGEGSYCAGVVYHHWVADSVSIRTVLREWFLRMYDPAKASRQPVRLPEAGYGRFFSLLRHGSAVGNGLLTAARFASSLRAARRVDWSHGVDLNVRIAMRELPEGWIDAVHAAARRRGVTLNDMFLAAIAHVCDRHVPIRVTQKRCRVALGSIVDLRSYGGGKPDDAFGLFLGFTNVMCRPADLADPERLVASIATQSRLQKDRGIPQASALRLLVGVAMGKVIDRSILPAFYHKHLPLAGGISNVHMSRTWAMEYHPAPLLDYIRVSPTGPMMPLVFATTTLGKRFHFVLTYRPSVVDEGRARTITDAFSGFLAKMC